MIGTAAVKKTMVRRIAKKFFVLPDDGHIAFILTHISHLGYILSYGARKNNNAVREAG